MIVFDVECNFHVGDHPSEIPPGRYTLATTEKSRLRIPSGPSLPARSSFLNQAYFDKQKLKWADTTKGFFKKPGDVRNSQKMEL